MVTSEMVKLTERKNIDVTDVDVAVSYWYWSIVIEKNERKVTKTID
jgi:hypothetical protein